VHESFEFHSAPTTMSAQSLLAQAAKKEASGSSSGFSSFFSGGSSSKLEEARELYNSAANAFKLEKSFKESGDAFVKAGDVAVKAGEKDDAALDYWNASKAYKKTHPERAAALPCPVPRLRQCGQWP
jgi:alpha-soluble NSF attachment protein